MARVQPGTFAAFRNVPGTPFGGPRFGQRPSSMPGAFGISKQTVMKLDNLIRNFSQGSKEFEMGMNTLVQLLAQIHRGKAMEKSAGPVSAVSDTRRGVGAGAPWTIPVRRITSAYYRGWRVRMISLGIWEVFNASREAWFIEHGVNPRSPAPIPRRIMKTSALDTLRFIQETRVAERFSADYFKLLTDDGHSHHAVGEKMSAALLSLAVRGGVNPHMAGPVGELP